MCDLLRINYLPLYTKKIHGEKPVSIKRRGEFLSDKGRGFLFETRVLRKQTV